MKYYKGTTENDIPVNGGSYVNKNKIANEDMNFYPLPDADGGFSCYGSVETKSTNRITSNELHIEKIEGCKDLKNEPFVDDVLVIFCAKPDRIDTWPCIVGWYKNARVYRNYEKVVFDTENGVFERYYNIEAFKEDVVLLPKELRQKRTVWWAPRAKKQGYGFGQANVWYPTDVDSEAGRNYLKRIVQQIEEYDGENWVDKFEEC